MEPDNPRTKDETLVELKQTCAEICELILAEYPPALLGTLWTFLIMSVFARTEAGAENLTPVSDDESTIVFAMEYVHAATACNSSYYSEFKNVDEETVTKLLELSGRAISLSFEYGFRWSGTDANHEDRNRLEFQILSTWILIRGRRYQVLEGEFFNYVLAPHDEILQQLYGVTAEQIAAGIQAATDSLRAGIEDARTRLQKLMDEVSGAAEGSDQGLNDIIAAANQEEGSDFGRRARSALEDLFFGGVFNLSKNTELPETLLADLAYVPGENTSFADGGPFSATPFRTLPGRIKPLIRYDSAFYCTEPNFLRDSAYRAIQRALIGRQPGYREDWNERQKRLSESAFGDVMSHCLSGARLFSEMYYPIGEGQWAECDNIIALDDALIVLECKARVEALAPPGENLDGHVRSIDRLLLDGYRQNKRTLEYLATTEEAPFYRLTAQGYEIAEKFSLKNFRRIFPICLTLECYTPFSAAIKELDGVEPILGNLQPIALAIDDLLAMKYIIKSAGELFHYLEVRQNLASMKNVLLFDEMDHLGAYISNNRIDITVKEDFFQKEQMDMVYLDGFDRDVLGPYFQNPAWPNVEPPRQIFPPVLVDILAALQRTRAAGWLGADSALRDLGSEGRNQVQSFFDRVIPNVISKGWTHFGMSGAGGTLVFFIERDDGEDRSQLARAQAQSYASAMGQWVRLYEVSVRPNLRAARATSRIIRLPSMIQADYAAIREEAAKLTKKIIKA
jgi:hypothetical protein